MLRIVRRGDRHDPRDLTVSFRFEGEFSSAFTDGEAEGLLPGETVKNMVHAAVRAARRAATGEAGAGARPGGLRAAAANHAGRVEVAEQPWQRLEAGGKAQAQTFFAAAASGGRRW